MSSMSSISFSDATLPDAHEPKETAAVGQIYRTVFGTRYRATGTYSMDCSGCDAQGLPKHCHELSHDRKLMGCSTSGGTPIIWHHVVSREETQRRKIYEIKKTVRELQATLTRLRGQITEIECDSPEESSVSDSGNDSTKE